jgi:hypothetical protein
LIYSTPIGCGGEFNDAEGELSSPGYPGRKLLLIQYKFDIQL